LLEAGGVTVLEETSNTRTPLEADSRRSPVNACSRRTLLEARCVTVVEEISDIRAALGRRAGVAGVILQASIR
jgi:hypothetical protein